MEESSFSLPASFLLSILPSFFGIANNRRADHRRRSCSCSCSCCTYYYRQSAASLLAQLAPCTTTTPPLPLPLQSKRTQRERRWTDMPSSSTNPTTEEDGKGMIMIPHTSRVGHYTQYHLHTLYMKRRTSTFFRSLFARHNFTLTHTLAYYAHTTKMQ